MIKGSEKIFRSRKAIIKGFPLFFILLTLFIILLLVNTKGNSNNLLEGECTIVYQQGKQALGVEARCPSGFIVTGGGWRDSLTGFGNEKDQDISMPSEDGRGWKCLSNSDDKKDAVCYAVCCDGELIETEILSSKLNTVRWDAFVGCSESFNILGGGFLDKDEKNDDQDESRPSSNGWYCQDDTSSSDSECYGVCGKSKNEDYELECVVEKEIGNQKKGVFVSCGEDYTLVGGGFNAREHNDDDQDINMPLDNGWYCAEDSSDDSVCYAACCRLEFVGECVVDEDCGEDIIRENYCLEGNVWHNITEFSCVDFGCLNETFSELVEDCGEESFSDYFCVGNNKTRIHYLPGCEQGSCILDNETESEVCEYECVNGECIEGVHDVALVENYDGFNHTIRLKDPDNNILEEDIPEIMCNLEYDIQFKTKNVGNFTEDVDINVTIKNETGEVVYSDVKTKTGLVVGGDTTTGNKNNFNMSFPSGLYTITVNSSILSFIDNYPENNFASREIEIVCEEECVPDINFTEWSNWEDLECVNDSHRNQSRFQIEYDANNCGFENVTHWEYRLIEDESCGDIECYDDFDCQPFPFQCIGNFCFDEDTIYQKTEKGACKFPGTPASFCDIELGEIFWRDCNENEVCEGDFPNARCVERGCIDDEECGNISSILICVEDDLVNKTTTPLCLQGECIDNITQEVIENCEYGCSGGECNPEPPQPQCTSNENCSAFNLPEIATCIYNPDGNSKTWDYFAGFTSTCNLTTNLCTTSTIILTHNYIVGNCSVECLEDDDCDSDEECNNYNCEEEEDDNGHHTSYISDYCGNGYCDIGENEENCPYDCKKQMMSLKLINMQNITTPVILNNVVNEKEQTLIIPGIFLFLIFLLLVMILILLKKKR